MLDCWTVMQMAQMKEMSLELLMEIRWEKPMVMLKVTSLVHLTVEQKEIQMVLMREMSLVCQWDCSMVMQKVRLMETK